LKIGAAFPRILDRWYPTIRPTYPLLTILNLLRMEDVAAVPLAEGPESRRAVFGFSSLPKLLKLPPESFDEFLEGPCERASDSLESVSVDDELDALLAAFKKRKLGLCFVRGRVNDEMATSLLSLNDVLRLYKTKRISSRLHVEDVASKISSMPESTPIRQALPAMFRLRHRTVFLSEKRRYVSDRSVIDRVFSPDSLERLRERSEDGVLDASIGSLQQLAPMEVAATTGLQAAAAHIKSDWGPCLTIQDANLLVTAWDIVMKPWDAGLLTISPRA